MANDWKCARCSAANSESSFRCSQCGLLRGSVVPPPASPAPPAPPAPGSPMDGPVETATPSSVEADGAVPPTKPIWRRIPLRLAVVGIVVAVALIGGWYFNAGRSSSGDITKAGDLAPGDLRVGDCFDLKDPTAEAAAEVTARPCADEHEYETFFVGTLPAGDHPTEAVFTTFVEETCLPAFEPYVGLAYEDSELDVFWFYPDGDAWNSGDRSVQCALYHPRIHQLTESLKGSNR